MGVPPDGRHAGAFTAHTPDAPEPLPATRCSQSMPLRDAIPRSSSRGPADTAPDSPATLRGQLRHAAVGYERALWHVAIAAMLVDVTLTVHGLELGLTEVNPVARHALGTFGVLGLYGLKGVALGLGGTCRLLVGRRYGALIPLGLAVPALAAVCINSILIASLFV